MAISMLQLNLYIFTCNSQEQSKFVNSKETWKYTSWKQLNAHNQNSEYLKNAHDWEMLHTCKIDCINILTVLEDSQGKIS
jgi:hypothetical protein